MRLAERVLPFVEMCTRNKHMKHEIPLGDSHVFIFDIDDTLYHSQEMWNAEKATISEAYKERVLFMTSDDEEFLASGNAENKLFYELFNMHPTEFQQRYDDPDVDKYLKPDFELKSLLESIEGIRLFCFTNGPAPRARKILKKLQLDHIFEAVICADIQDTEFILKPTLEAFQFIQNFMSITQPEKIHFFDDAKRNINGAFLQGWNAYIVNKNIKERIRHVLDSIKSYEIGKLDIENNVIKSEV